VFFTEKQIMLLAFRLLNLEKPFLQDSGPYVGTVDMRLLGLLFNQSARDHSLNQNLNADEDL